MKAALADLNGATQYRDELSKKLGSMDVAGDLAAAAADERSAQDGDLPPEPVLGAGADAAHSSSSALGVGVDVDMGVEVEAERVVSAHDPLVEVAVVQVQVEDYEGDESPVAGGRVSVCYSLFRGQGWAQAQAQAQTQVTDAIDDDDRSLLEQLQRLPALEDQWCDDDHIALYCIADATDEVRERGLQGSRSSRTTATTTINYLDDLTTTASTAPIPYPCAILTRWGRQAATVVSRMPSSIPSHPP